MASSDLPSSLRARTRSAIQSPARCGSSFSTARGCPVSGPRPLVCREKACSSFDKLADFGTVASPRQGKFPGASVACQPSPACRAASSHSSVKDSERSLRRSKRASDLAADRLALKRSESIRHSSARSISRSVPATALRATASFSASSPGSFFRRHLRQRRCIGGRRRDPGKPAHASSDFAGAGGITKSLLRLG